MPRSPLVVLAVLAAAPLTSCLVSVSLDDKRCGTEHACVDGYECVDAVCVPSGLAGEGLQDAGPRDAGTEDDGAHDAGGHDAAVDDDAGSPDAGAPAAGPSDAGDLDAGGVDAGGIDAGEIDSGPIDAGPIDSGPPDAGPPPIPTSCAHQLELDPASPSGEYEIEVGGELVSVTCDMVRDGGGWTRVVRVEASSGTCPGEWVWRYDPMVCTRALTTAGARSATFAVPLASYREVSGYVRGVQKGNMDTFGLFGGGSADLDGDYVDGVSLTLEADGERAHLWTYAVAWSDTDNAEDSRCPCLGGAPPHAFVGTHFYCESGAADVPSQGTWYTADPLWDGDGTGTDCDTNGDPSWFMRSFATPTSSDIEVRLMADQESDNEDVGVTELELWVR